MARVDPRVWNLLAGASLVAGACTERSIDDGIADATETGDGDGGGDGDDGDGEGDDGDGDGDDGDYGDDYYEDGYHDEWTEYECYAADECGALEVCVSNECTDVPEFPACVPTAVPGIPLVVDGETLALSFVDLDADSAAELVAATQTELYVFESGSNDASVSARVIESPSISAMVAGDFDLVPGQDLTLLVDDMLVVHASDGIDGFDAPSASESPQFNGEGMLAGEFDDAAPTDLLFWGPNGSSALADGWFVLLELPIVSAAAHEWSTNSGRFVLRSADMLHFYSLAGELGSQVEIDPGSAAFVTSITQPEHLDVSATVYGAWTLVQVWEPGNLRGQWGVLGAVSAIASGDLDGDGHDEVPLIRGGGVTLIGNFENGNKCATAFEFGELGQAAHVAIGDWDGDEDDELAIAFATGELAVFDGEG